MFWVLLIIALIVMAFYFKWARYLLAALVGIVAIIALYLVNASSENQKKAEAAKHRMSASDLAIQDTTLSSPAGNYSSQLSGRVRNLSPRYTLTNLQMRVVVQDCVDAICDTVGDETESIYVRVPPGQVRDFGHSFYFPNVARFRGKWQWNYTVQSVSADDSSN